MKPPKLSYFVGAGALLGLIGLAAAATDPASPHLFRRALLEKVAELGMTDAQKTQIHAILRDSQPNLQPLIKQYVEERRALRRTIHTTPADEAAIRAQATRVAQLESDLEVKRAYVAERICALLTPEQITKLKEPARGVDATVDAAIERISNKIAGP
jgi:Spy/CpxP family protein refolding chaperone